MDCGKRSLADMSHPRKVKDQVCHQLAAFLKRDVNSIQPNLSLRDDLGLDSMATIELLFMIEETFDLQIPDEDLQDLTTVQNVIAYVEGALAKRSPKPRATRAPSRPASKK